jgi:murein DD-endopeptidase MepM/ murein hydrolase activator NlpD
LFRRAVVALSIPTALFATSVVPNARPVAVEATPVAASVAQVAPAAEGALALGAPRTQAPTVGTVTASALNLRSGPGTGYRILATLPRGTQGTVLSQSNGWYKISTNRGTGWVSGRYFQVGTAPTLVSQPLGVVGARRAMVPNGTFISGWGVSRSGGRTHQGEDLAAPRGSAIYAPARLSIISNTWNSYGGWTVIGRDAKGRWWYFAHLNSRSGLPVGSTVGKGQFIGSVGTSGNAEGTTPHLHYQVSWSSNNWGNPVSVLQNYPDVP